MHLVPAARMSSPRTPKRSRNSASDDYLCGICLSTVVNAHQTGCCGALFCNGCCKNVSAAQSRCPNCRHAQATFHKDAFRERMAAALVLTCDTCGFSAKRDEYSAHAATHGTPDAKVERLELKLRESEQKLAETRAELAQLQKARDQAETFTLRFHPNSESIIRFSMWDRFGGGDVFCRFFSGASGSIAVAHCHGRYSVTIEWSHFNVSLSVQRVGGKMQNDAEITVRLAHLDRSKDRADHFTLTPNEPSQQLENWMSIRQLEQYRLGSGSIAFAVDAPGD